MTTKQLNRRQARWAEFLSEFNFKITYRPGRQGTKPDSLTRRVGDLPEGNDARIAFQNQVLLKKGHLDDGVQRALQLASILLDNTELRATALAAMLYDISEQEESSSEVLGEEPTDITQIKDAYDKDDLAQAIMLAKHRGDRRLPLELVKRNIRIELGECEVKDGLLYVGNRLYIPDVPELRIRLIKDIHDAFPGGHAGRASTYDRVSSHYYWPRITNSVDRFVKSCSLCKMIKSSREAKHGLLKPLPIPERYWYDISVDFVTPLPVCSRYNRKYEHIMVVVDRLSKKKKFIGLDSMEVEAVV